MKGGSIYKEGNKWVWKSPPYDGGKRTRKTFDTQEAAEEQREIFLAKFTKGKNNYVCGMTVREAYERWQKYEWADEFTYTYKTQGGYRSIFKKHILPYIGDSRIDNLNVAPFNRHLHVVADEGKCKKTIDNIIQPLRALLTYSKNIGWIDIDNSDEIEDIVIRKRPSVEIKNVISESEYKLIYHMMNVRQCSMYAPIVKFIKNTGIRAEEIAIKDCDIVGSTLRIQRAIKRRYVDDDHTELVVTPILKSSHAYRTIPLNDEAKEAIKEFKEWKKRRGIESEYIFCSSTGNLLEYRNLLRAFHTAIAKVNEEEGCNIDRKGIHSLRKLFCKTLYNLVKDWEKARRIMGHSATSVTQQYYYEMDFDDIEDIAEQMSAI